MHSGLVLNLVPTTTPRPFQPVLTQASFRSMCRTLNSFLLNPTTFLSVPTHPLSKMRRVCFKIHSLYDPCFILPWPERILPHTLNSPAISYDTRLKHFSSVIHFPHLKSDKYTHRYMHKNLGYTALPCLEGVGNVKFIGRQPLKMQK